MEERVQGKVKWFDENKGYGFIERNDGGDDVFLHFSALKQAGFKTIADDTDVSFDVEQGPKAPKRRTSRKCDGRIEHRHVVR